MTDDVYEVLSQDLPVNGIAVLSIAPRAHGHVRVTMRHRGETIDACLSPDMARTTAQALTLAAERAEQHRGIAP